MMKHAALLGLLLLQGQEPTRTRQDDQFGPVTFWDGDYLVAEIRGQTGTYDQTAKTGAVRNGRALYYTKPRTPGDKSHKVSLEFPAAEVDDNKKNLALPEGAVVHMDDGSRIEAQQLEIDYRLQRLTSKKPVKITKPNAVLTGSGLEADDEIKQMIIPSDAYLEIRGRPGDVAPDKTPADPPSPIVTRLHCEGAMTLRDIGGPEKLFVIHAEKGVEFVRHEPDGDTRMTGDSLVVYFAKRGNALEPISATGRGRISLTDSKGTKASASSLDWEYRDDIVKLRDVDFSMKTQRIAATSAVIDRWAGVARFEGDLRADVAPEEGQPPLGVTAKLLEVGIDGVGPSWVAARGDVAIDGDFGPEGRRQRLKATGSEFVWDVGTGSGRLLGKPFATIVQGESTILAPLLVFEGRSLIVLKGPKRLVLTHVTPPPLALRVRNALFSLPRDLGGKRFDVRLSTDSDIQVNSGAGLVSVLGRCEAQTPDFTLASDRLFLRLTPSGDGLEEARAYGRVRVTGGPQGVGLAGDALVYRPESGGVEVVGAPRAFATVKDVEVAARWLRYDQKTQTVSAGRRR